MHVARSDNFYLILQTVKILSSGRESNYAVTIIWIGVLTLKFSKSSLVFIRKKLSYRIVFIIVLLLI